MIAPEYTVVVALDKRTMEFFAHSFEVWRKKQPDLLEKPWLLIFDETQLDKQTQDLVAGYVHGSGVDDVATLPWGSNALYDSQREKMLTSFVMAAPYAVKTNWWLKIDVDAIPQDATGPMHEAEWFCPANEPLPVMIASGWSYTKPKDQMSQLDNWADRITNLGIHPRLNLPFDPDSNKCKHKRIASWIFFCDTRWSQKAAAFAAESHGPYKMPVPSQDGYHWYIAARTKQPIKRVNFKRRGWSNHSKLRSLRQRIAELNY